VSDDLTKLFADVLNVDTAALSDDSSPDTVSEWDSLAAMNLVVEIEEVFGVELSTRDIMSLTTIGLARKFLRQKNIDV
jgi:acyl carrier protein